jgi:hypothetical protein
MSEPLHIFVSHASEYAELAMTLKRSLEALEGDEKLDIRVSVTMPGGSDWRDWIENNVRSADLFLLLYPDERMDLNWCNYELGRFFDGGRHIVCLKNVDIEKPPPVFEPFQAYDGDEDGIFKFLQELFDSETFTPGKKLNPEIGVIGKADYDRAKDVARQLAAEFAKARVREKFYDRRIVISLHHTGKVFDADRTVVEGNPEGMAVLGLEKDTKISWAEMRTTLDPKFQWPSQLETSLTQIARGQLPPSLPPFRIANNIYVPVIARSETVDKVLRRLAVIFIAIAKDNIHALVEWVTPAAMPENFAALVRLIRMILRARWDFLEPGLMQAKYSATSDEQCAAIVASILSGYEQIALDARQQGFKGPAQFMGVFDRNLRPTVEEMGGEYIAAMEVLRDAGDQTCKQVVAAITRLLSNNAGWLQLAAEQFANDVGDLDIKSLKEST